MKKMRRAFAMLDMAFALVIMGIVLVGYIELTQSAKEDRAVYSELSFYKNFESDIKITFLKILDAFEGPCSKIANDSSTKWGWGSGSCNKTSPYPAYVSSGGGRKLHFDIQWNSLTSVQRTALEDTIRSTFGNVCKTDAATSPKDASGITLFCPKITGLTYKTNGGYVARAHTLGKSIDPQLPPIVQLSYRRVSEIGEDSASGVAHSDELHRFSLGEVFQFRQNYTLNKFNKIRQSLLTFHKTQLYKEVENNPPAGLHSMDDEFVPWFWKIFGDNKTDVFSKMCSITGGSCTNLNTNQIWRNSVSGKGLLFRRIVANLMTENRFAVDGFNNQVNFYPIASQCTAADIDTCGITVPPLPADNYITTGGNPPPFVSILYVDGQNNKNTNVPPYARMYISY